MSLKICLGLKLFIALITIKPDSLMNIENMPFNASIITEFFFAYRAKVFDAFMNFFDMIKQTRTGIKLFTTLFTVK